MACPRRTFIKADVSLIRTVDDVCRNIKSTETSINLLFISTGTMVFQYEYALYTMAFLISLSLGTSDRGPSSRSSSGAALSGSISCQSSPPTQTGKCSPSRCHRGLWRKGRSHRCERLPTLACFQRAAISLRSSRCPSRQSPMKHLTFLLFTTSPAP